MRTLTTSKLVIELAKSIKTNKAWYRESKDQEYPIFSIAYLEIGDKHYLKVDFQDEVELNYLVPTSNAIELLQGLEELSIGIKAACEGEQEKHQNSVLNVFLSALRNYIIEVTNTTLFRNTDLYTTYEPEANSIVTVEPDGMEEALKEKLLKLDNHPDKDYLDVVAGIEKVGDIFYFQVTFGDKAEYGGARCIVRTPQGVDLAMHCANEYHELQGVKYPDTIGLASKLENAIDRAASGDLGAFGGDYYNSDKPLREWYESI